MEKQFEIKLNEAAHEGHVFEDEADREGFALLDTVLRLFMQYALENTEGATVPDDLDAKEAVEQFEITHFDTALGMIHNGYKHLLAGAQDFVNGVDHREDLEAAGGLGDLLKFLAPPAGNPNLN